MEQSYQAQLSKDSPSYDGTGIRIQEDQSLQGTHTDLHVMHALSMPPSCVRVLPTVQRKVAIVPSRAAELKALPWCCTSSMWPPHLGASARAYLVMALASSSTLCVVLVLMPATHSVPCHTTVIQASFLHL